MSRSEEIRDRTKKFAGSVVRFYVGLDKSREELRVLGRQLLRCGTSVGANYREASRARSDGEFIAKVELCSQEADETQYWLELIRDDCGMRSEADELICIFVSMSKKTKAKKTS